MKLKDLLTILPKYDTNNSYGKIGDIKSTVKFVYSGTYLTYKELNEELIDNTIVELIEPIASAYHNRASRGLLVICKEE